MTYASDSQVTYLVIHYSATPVERDVSAADIDRMHRDRGFREIGYHFYIRKDGTVERGRDLTQEGRFEVGAHSKGENSASIGICYEGGVRLDALNVGFDSRTEAQEIAMIKLIRELLQRFPGAKVMGHRDMPGAATQCPGFNASGWWDSVAGRHIPEPQGAYAGHPRATPAKSKTLWSQVTQWASTGGVGFIAWVQSQDSDMRYIIAGLLAVGIVTGAIIFRERLKHWAAGVW